MTVTVSFGGDANDLPDGDMDPSARDLDETDITVVIQAIVRRLTTELGGLWYDLTYGENVRLLLSHEESPGDIENVRQSIAAQCLLDERIDHADCVIETFPSENRATVTVTCVTGLGPFTLSLAITEVSVTVLNQAA